MNPTLRAARKWLFRQGSLLPAADAIPASLRSRLGPAAAAACAAGMLLLTISYVAKVEREMREAVAYQQRTIAVNVAGDVGRKVSMARDMLEELARRLPPGQLRDSAVLEALIRSNGALYAVFDDIVILDSNGVVAADWPRVPGRRGLDRSAVEHIRSVLATGAPHVSKPFAGPSLGVPVVVLTVPAPDPGGRTAGAVAGLLQLGRPNFLGELATRKIGASGYFILVDAEGTVMVDPQPGRILGKLMDDGAAAAVADRRPDGGMHESRDGRLYAASDVPETAWTLVAVSPTDEAYRSLASRRWTLAGVFTLLLAATGLAVWMIAGRLFAANRSLRGERAFVDAVVERADALVVVLDREGRIRRFNRACEELSGYRFAEVEGKFPWETVLPPEEAQTVRTEAFEALARAPRWLTGHHTNYWLAKSGERRSLEWRNSLLVDAAGEMEFMVSVGIDVTEVQQARHELEQSRARLRNILDSLFGFVGVFSLDGRLLEANDAPLRAAGVTRDAVIGKPFWDTYWWNYSPSVQSQLRDALRRAAQGEVVRYDVPIRVKDGGRMTIDVQFGPLRDAGGEIAQIIGFAVDVTERERAEESVMRSERYSRVLLDSMPFAIGYADPAERITFANRVYRDIYCGGADPAGRTIREVMGEQIHAMVEPWIQRALAGEDVEYERSYARADGSAGTRWVRYVPDRDRGGRIIGFYALIEDLTERKRAEEQLHAERNFSAAIYDSTPALVIVHDRHGRIVRFNQAAKSASGYREEDLAGRYSWELLMGSPEDQSDVKARFAALADMSCAEAMTRFGAQVTRTWRTRDGRLRLISWNLAYLPDESGRVAYQVACGHDITDRIAAEAAIRASNNAIRESEARLRNAQRIAGLGSWELDLSTGRLQWSDEIFRMFEIDPLRFGASYEAFLEAIHPEDRGAVNEAYQRSVAGKSPYEITHRLRMADGRVKHVTERGETFYDATGKPLRSVGTVQDITERKQAEDRVRTALAEKEVLLKEIYHRVKNNLQVVSSLLNMQRRQVSDAGVKELLAESANRVKSMALVHEQLYRSHDLSNISFGEYLGQLAEHLASAHRPLSARVPLRLEAGEFRLGLETAVPLGLIVNELVSNAYKHGYGADAARGEIVLRAESLPDGRLRLSVTDDGRGLPEGFDPAAADSLGMQLVGTLAQQLGGELRCGSQAGRTCFQVLFRPGAREA